MRPSTRAFFEEADKAGKSFYEKLHGYCYGRWPYLYIGVGTGERKLAGLLLLPFLLLINRMNPIFPKPGNERHSFADSYHGKAVPLSEATKLVTLNREVPATDLEQVIPYSQAREIVLSNPAKIVLLDCPCRSVRENPCLPLDVCLIVGDPVAQFLLDHHPRKARRITSEEAVRVLREADARGHVHHAFFKEAVLGRFYAICNCCSCCCGAMSAHRNGIPMLCSSGYLARCDEQACVGCGNCVEFCQFGALSVSDRRLSLDTAQCMGCGVCVSKCPKDALSLVRAPEKGRPLLVDELPQA
ncbi:MAG: 4Fe-4S binding protein [Desulfovibrionaceae bacterium]